MPGRLARERASIGFSMVRDLRRAGASVYGSQCPDSEVRHGTRLGPGANFGIIRDTGIIDLLV
jgi:hypothetical protein